MSPPFNLPADVIQFIDRVFAACNQKVAAKLARLPTLHETYLDLALIEGITDVAAPHVTQSGYVIDTDVHFLGSGRHWQSWEVADLGVILSFRHAERLVRTKVALLQSKRLYPRESEFVEDEPLGKYAGFGDLLNPGVLPAQDPRVFHFDRTCRYRALQVGDDQWHAIANYEGAYDIPVHYLLYHPTRIPHKQVLPVLVTGAPTRNTRPAVGCRVVPASVLRAATAGHPRNYAPSYGDLASSLAPQFGKNQVGWRLESFVSDELLNCREGYIAREPFGNDEGLLRVFAQRGAPISAALRIEISAPDEAELLQ